MRTLEERIEALEKIELKSRQLGWSDSADDFKQLIEWLKELQDFRKKAINGNLSTPKEDSE